MSYSASYHQGYQDAHYSLTVDPDSQCYRPSGPDYDKGWRAAVAAYEAAWQ